MPEDGPEFDEADTLREAPAVKPQSVAPTRAMTAVRRDELESEGVVPEIEGDLDLDGDGERPSGPLGGLRALARAGMAALRRGGTPAADAGSITAELELESDEPDTGAFTEEFARMRAIRSREGIALSELAVALEQQDIALPQLLADEDNRTLVKEIGDASYFLSRKRTLDPAFRGDSAPQRRYTGPLHIFGYDDSYNGLKVKSFNAYRNLCIALLAAYEETLPERFDLPGNTLESSVRVDDEVCALRFVPTRFVSLSEDTMEELGVALSPSGSRYLVRMRQSDDDFLPAMLPLPNDLDGLREYITFFFEGVNAWGDRKCDDLLVQWERMQRA